jgi:hypothetical protein
LAYILFILNQSVQSDINYGTFVMKSLWWYTELKNSVLASYACMISGYKWITFHVPWGGNLLCVMLYCLFKLKFLDICIELLHGSTSDLNMSDRNKFGSIVLQELF